ncbi:MAG: CvpA family protein [Hyphomicrobium sp.]|nr:CvpA family protein [Hyphomicrobium sp.]
MMGPLTYLDMALLAVCFISGLLAMYRGLARELLSIISWIAAAAVGAWIFFTKKDFSTDIAAQTGLPPQIALAVVALVVALIVLIIVHLVTARISDAILDSRVGMIDRILGFAFGVARGFILIVIPYMFYESFFPDEKSHFPWVRDAASKPYIQSTGASIRSVLMQVVPSSLTTPPTTEPAPEATTPGQQGGLELLNRDGRLVTLAFGSKRYYMTAV